MEIEIFLQTGLDAQPAKRPVGQIRYWRKGRAGTNAATPAAVIHWFSLLPASGFDLSTPSVTTCGDDAEEAASLMSAKCHYQTCTAQTLDE
jgi:hypothetical protein